jgi:hypothetical protein
MSIINRTPHDINLYKEEDTVFVPEIRKLVVKEGAVPYLTIPAGTPVNAKQAKTDAGNLYGVPCKEFTFESVDSLPDDDHHYIVSALYVAGAKAFGNWTDSLLTVRGTVYAFVDQPKPVGCLGFYRN